jgi:hypothetical protein
MSQGNTTGAVALAILGVLFIGVAVFYVVANTTLLASTAGPHYKHAGVAVVLAVCCFVGANFVRNRASA